MAIKVGDKVVVIKGRDKRGRTGVVTSIEGKCAGEDAAFVLIDEKRCKTHTFFPISYLAAIK